MLSRGLLVLLVVPTSALHAYGHAYSRPNDFTPAQYAQIAARFEIFTVEKDHAASVYGNATAAKPFTTNSIAASVGTARKIKAINPAVKVLMYWNSALFFDLYECEADVDKKAWLMPGPPHKPKPLFYNYSVPAMRKWWVKCAIDAVQSSGGALDGLFFDATPKLAAAKATALWGSMVDEIRAALGADAILLDNGFFLSSSGEMLGGDDAWSHTKFGYIESLEKIGHIESLKTVENSLLYLSDVSNASALHPAPTRRFIGHGDDFSDATFAYSLATYMMVTSSMKEGWFLANNGSYSIDGGLLNQPRLPYSKGGLGCGEPSWPYYTIVSSTPSSVVVQRLFTTGHVELDLVKDTSVIHCDGRAPRLGAAHKSLPRRLVL
jgi:hypothetical protein|tara:strand:- start:151 stop:1287 length:1137 start_codon:yes stop_codon:yes gene_type:complete